MIMGADTVIREMETGQMPMEIHIVPGTVSYTHLTGIGMSKEYLKHIFEPFSQERNDSGSTQQGIGLGMSIVKGLIEKMGGTIKIKSEEGIGSTFIIRISFKLASAPDTVKKTAAQMDILSLIHIW